MLAAQKTTTDSDGDKSWGSNDAEESAWSAFWSILMQTSEKAEIAAAVFTDSIDQISRIIAKLGMDFSMQVEET